MSETRYVQVRPAANGLAIASMVLGIIAVVLSATFILIVLALPIAIVGWVLGLFGRSAAMKRGGVGRGQAIAGLVLNALPIALVLISWIIGAVSR